MREQKKRAYPMHRSVGFMLASAWRGNRSVIFLCVAVAAVTAGRSVADLLIAPTLLAQVESGAGLGALLAAVGGFGAVLVLLSALKGYLDNNVLFGRIAVRLELARDVARKTDQTSFPNLLDTAFLALQDKCWNVTGSNADATEAVWTTLTDLLTNLMGFGVYLLLMSGLHPGLLCLVVVVTVAGCLFDRRIQAWGYEHRAEQDGYYKQFHYIGQKAADRSPAKDIRIFGLQSWLRDVRESAVNLIRAFKAREQRHYLWADLADFLLTLARNGAAYAYLLWLTLEEGLSASEFLLYFTAVSGFTAWVTGITSGLLELHRQCLDISCVQEYLNWPEPFRFEGGKPLPKDTDHPYELRLDDVSYRYPGAELDTISHFSLTIRPGEKLAIVGLNGAGKTTLVRLLCGFLDPTDGRVLLDGEDIRQYDRRDYYALFATVFQDFSVLEHSVRVNVAQRLEGIDEERVRRCIDQAGLTEMVARLPQGLDTKLGRLVYEDGVELSGGQTQRLMLARALYKDAPILALDEPTAALDPIAENDIYLKYSEMTRGRTALFISHRLASTRFCDRILFLADGRLAEEGTHQSLLELGGGYAKLFEVQSRYYREGGVEDGAGEKDESALG
ncbi:MAG: ABC transporter ATP-binding protein/permease [Clostridiales bacterium]|nr:ABC transporter ATP-binding protein/permease [Clostridiales bacterium]